MQLPKRGVPALPLASVQRPPASQGAFKFCPSPRKVNVKPEQNVAARVAEAAPTEVAVEKAAKPKIQVVKEELTPDYEPAQEEVEEYAAWLGMDLVTEKHLFWIARQALKAPCPEPWKPCLTEDDEVFYFNFQTGESIWDHPVDVHSKKLYLDSKNQKAAGTTRPVPALCLNLPVQSAGGIDCRSPRKVTARAKAETTLSIAKELVQEATRGIVAKEAQTQTKVTVMEEELDPNYEPTQEEIEEYAVWLGMKMETDRPLLWIALAGLKEPCPEPWKPCKLADGELFYFNFATGESIWDHPCDRIYQEMYAKHKQM